MDVEIDALKTMRLGELHQCWRDRWGCAPPAGRAVELLRLEIAWRLQSARYGDIDATTKRLLRKLAKSAQPAGSSAAKFVAPLGATFAREWRGKTYVVKVTPEGYLYDGRVHRSLSVLACAITGGHWSGPRFFGLANQ
jgi:hypothetical protein